MEMTLEQKKRYGAKTFIAIAIPIVIQGLVFQLQSIVDKAFLGHLQTEYLTAIGVTQSPFHMTMTLIMAIATGLSIVVGHRYGAGEKDDLKESIGSTIGYNLILSFFLLSFWLLFSEFFFGLINVDQTIVPYAVSYVSIMAVYLPLYAVDSSIQGTLQAFGKTKPIMYVGIIKVVLNIFLDWVLIFGRFGLPKMGIQGAALATLLANIIASFVLIIYFRNNRNLPIHMKIKELFGFRFHIYKKIAALGLPTGLEFFLWHIGNVVILGFLNVIDKNGVAVYVLASSIGLLVFMIYMGISKATMTQISQGMGAKAYHLIRGIMVRSVIYNMIFVTGFFFLARVFEKSILGIFTNDSQLIEMASPMMIYLLLTLYPKSMNVVIGHGIRALGKTKWMLYTQIGGTILVVTMSFLLTTVFQVGLLGIFITIMVDEFVRSIINTWYFIDQTRTENITSLVQLT